MADGISIAIEISGPFVFRPRAARHGPMPSSGAVGLMATFRAAKTIFDLKGGKASNLSLQKLLYLSHMVHLGTKGMPLATNEFQAWDYGPIEPELYHKLKAYGSSNVPSIFPAPAYEDGSDEFESITVVMDQLKDTPSRKLVEITHWKGGAWAKHYSPSGRSIKIPDRDILKEFHDRNPEHAAASRGRE